MNKIYKLEHQGNVIYVGRTKRTLKDRHKGKWPCIPIDKHELDIILLEETEDVSRERYWIQYYKDLGCTLYNKTKGDGLDYKQYYLDNRDKLLIYGKEYRETKLNEDEDYYRKYYRDNKEKLDDRRKEYNKENKEKISEYHKKNYEDNKEERKEKMRKYMEDNKERLKIYRKKYYSNKNKK